VVDILDTESVGGFCVSFVPGYGLINFEGRTNLSCPFCTDGSFTSLLNFTRTHAGSDVGFPSGSWFGRRSSVGFKL
jgi:hypothetical protein